MAKFLKSITKYLEKFRRIRFGDIFIRIIKIIIRIIKITIISDNVVY